MGRGYERRIGADTRDFERAVKDGVIKPVEDAARSLDDLGDSGDDAGDRTARSLGKLEEALRDAAAQSDRTEARFKDVGDSARDAGDAGSTGLGRLGSKGAEVSDELRGNLGETFSSFRGDLADLPQIAQDTLGGLAGSGALGGIPGLAATAAGAAGLGLIIGAFDDINKKNEESQKRVTEWADKFIEAGERVLSAGQIISGTNDILTDTAKFNAASDAAEQWGVSFETAALAMSGHPQSIQAVSESLDDQRRAFERARDAGELNYEQQDEALKQLGDATSRYRELTDEMEMGSHRAGIMSQALKNIAETTEGATTKVDRFGDRVTTLPDGTTIYIDAETGQATDDVEAIKDKVYGIKDQDVRIDVKADTGQAKRDIVALRREAAKPVKMTVYQAQGNVRQRG